MSGSLFIHFPMKIPAPARKMIAAIGVFALTALPGLVLADDHEAEEAGETAGWTVKTVFGIEISGGTGATPLADLVNQLLVILYSLAGLSAVLMIILGAYRYMAAAGNPKDTQEAKETIQSAIIGLVMILTAALIAELIGGVFGIDFLNVNL